MKSLLNFINESSHNEIYIMLAQWGENKGSNGIAFIKQGGSICSSGLVKKLCNSLSIEFSDFGYKDLKHPVACYNFGEQKFEWVEENNVKSLEY